MYYDTSSILVLFSDDCSVEALLDDLKVDHPKVSGIKVSGFFPRWSIDVPHGKERYFQNKFKRMSEVKTVYDSYLEGKSFGKKKTATKSYTVERRV